MFDLSDREIWEAEKKRIFENKRNKLRERYSQGRKLPTFAEDEYSESESSKQARAYAQNFDKMKEKGYGLLLYGKPDQGKTYLADCIAERLLNNGAKVLFSTSAGIVRKAQRFKGDPIEEIKDCDLLVLDDLGSERQTEFANETIQELVDRFYSMKKPMIITTNLTPKEMAQDGIVRLRTYSRILGRCLPVEVDNGRTRANAETYTDMLNILKS